MSDPTELDRLRRKMEHARLHYANTKALPAAFVLPGELERAFTEWLAACAEHAAEACRQEGAA